MTDTSASKALPFLIPMDEEDSAELFRKVFNAPCVKTEVYFRRFARGPSLTEVNLTLSVGLSPTSNSSYLFSAVFDQSGGRFSFRKLPDANMAFVGDLNDYALQGLKKYCKPYLTEPKYLNWG